MSADPRIIDLVLRWEEQRDQGQDITPEELCRDCPELLEDLRRAIAGLRALSPLLSTVDEPAVTPPSPAPDNGTAAAWAVPGSRYEPRGFHAQGGLGEIHRGEDVELHRPVALKRIQERRDSADNRRRFLREAEITARLQHPGIVPVYGLVQDDDGRPCYAMRFIEGESLKDAIGRFHDADRPGRDPGERNLALRRLLNRFVAACRTVAYAHSRGIMHLDLKPGNIMLGDYDETLVVDWGLARPFAQRGPERSGGELTLLPVVGEDEASRQMGQAPGTPAYMSPEQASGRWDVIGPASDVYSLGATLHSLLTGRAPFTGSTPAEGLQGVKRGDFASPHRVKPAVPRPLEAVCRKALAPVAEDRYATAVELAAEVERWLGDEPVRAYREPFGARARRWVRHHRTLVTSLAAVLVVSVLLLGGAVGWLAARRAETARAAGADLVEADRFQREEKWADARAAVQRAEARLGGGGPAELSEQARQAEANLALVDRLEEIVNDYTTPRSGETNGPGPGAARAEEAYADAFPRHGWDVASLTPEEAARRIRASAIQDRLLTGLEQWAYVKGWANRPGGEHLLAVVAAVDPDPWRKELREAWVRQDRAAVSRLIVQADVPHLPTASVLALGRMAVLGDGSPEVIRVFKEAQRRMPQDVWTNLNLAYLLLKAWPPRKAEALGYYRAALVLRPGNARLRLQIAGALVEQRAFQEAEAIFQELLRDEPRDADVHAGMGWMYFEQGRLEQAEAEYRAALDLNPDLADAHQDLGRIRERQGRLTEALASYDEAIRLKYPHAWVHVNRAWVLLRLHRPAEAEAACQTAIGAEPELAIAHHHLGLALDAQGRLPEALAAFEAALRSDHGYAEAQGSIGVVLRKQGKHAQSEEACRRAIRLKPTLPEGHLNLAVSLLNQNRLPEAEAAAREAIHLRPEDALAHFDLGIIFWKTGQQEKAISAWREAIRLQPHFREAAGNLVAMLRDLGRFDECLQVVRQCPELGAAWVTGAERLVALDRRLPQVLGGKDKPTDAEQLEFAHLCLCKKFYRSAARFFDVAFAAQPRLAGGSQPSDRYNAARAAALAAGGIGGDVNRLDDAERARLRAQALGWLRADLGLWAKQLETGTAQARAAVKERLQHWQRDPDLAGLRDAAGIGRLPEAEWGPCLKLWADVDALLRRAEGGG